MTEKKNKFKKKNKNNKIKRYSTITFQIIQNLNLTYHL